MQKLLLLLLEEAKKDKQKLQQLLILAIDYKLYELAARIRKIRNDLFPESSNDIVEE